MYKKKLPDQKKLCKLLTYNRITGELLWKPRPGHTEKSIWFNQNCAGKPAFACKTKAGYLNGAICGKIYLAHRIIWKMMYGTEPDEIDHINHVRDDNRLENLRSVTHVENMHNARKHRNNKSGITGVFYVKKSKRWIATIGEGGELETLGSSKNKFEAIAMRKLAEDRYGFHINHGQ